MRDRIYDAAGSGPAVILIHGSLSNGRQWRSLAERLADRFRVLSLDLYMTQDDGGPRVGDFSFDDDVAFVEALLAEHAPVHLVGHSYGGVVAARAALNQRDRLASLTLIEPSCFHLLDKTSGEHFAEIMALRNDGLAFAEKGDAAGQARHFIEYWMGPQAWITMPERRQAAILASLKRLDADWLGTLHPHCLDDYRGLNVPTLMLRARDTRRPSFHLVDMIGGVLPNAQIAEVPSGGHMSPITNPDAVNNEIERFLLARR